MQISPGVTFMHEYKTADRARQEHLSFAGKINYDSNANKLKEEKKSGGIVGYMLQTFKNIDDGKIRNLSLFDMESNQLDENDLAKKYQEFQKAQDNNSILQMSVISFNNDYLEKYGIYNSKNNELNYKVVRDFTRQVMKTIFNESKYYRENNCVWTAGIHRDTDNIHIHISFVEKDFKQRPKNEYGLEPSVIRKIKSTVARNIQGNYFEIQKNNILRGQLREDTKDLIKKHLDNKAALDLIVSLPENYKKVNDKRFVKEKKALRAMIDNIMKNEEFSDVNKKLNNLRKGIVNNVISKYGEKTKKSAEEFAVKTIEKDFFDNVIQSVLNQKQHIKNISNLYDKEVQNAVDIFEYKREYKNTDFKNVFEKECLRYVIDENQFRNKNEYKNNYENVINQVKDEALNKYNSLPIQYRVKSNRRRKNQNYKQVFYTRQIRLTSVLLRECNQHMIELRRNQNIYERDIERRIWEANHLYY